jgi:hypothetical protein
LKISVKAAVIAYNYAYFFTNVSRLLLMTNGFDVFYGKNAKVEPIAVTH